MTISLPPVRVRIQNFQSIDDLEFEVSGFTCITGKTNIGKSAIMRAMSRALLNDPVTGMVRKGQKFSSVEMSSDGWGFLWEKGEKDVNRYSIDGKVFDKTGQVQLPEVEAMGFRSVRVGDDDLEPWWASQTRPVFLLDKSGPQITNFISEVSRLQVYQNAIVLAAKYKRRQQDEGRVKAEELGRVQEKLSKLTGLAAVERLESDLEEQIRSLQECAQRAITLEELHKSIESVAVRLRDSKAAADFKLKTSYDAVDELVRKSVSLARLHLRLQGAARRIIATKPVESLKVPELPVDDVARLRKLVRCLRIVPLQRSVEASARVAKVKVPDVGAAETAVAALLRLRKASSRIVALQAAVRRAESLPAAPELPDGVQRLRSLSVSARRMEELRANIEAADAEEKRLNALKKKAEKKMAAAQVCPECGQKLPEHTHAKGKKALSA